VEHREIVGPVANGDGLCERDVVVGGDLAEKCPFLFRIDNGLGFY
jgi:hypothetical protein